MADGTLTRSAEWRERRVFYVYLISRRDGRPCYVGKGKGPRWKQHARAAYNPHLRRIYAQSAAPLPARKIAESLTDAEAHELEKFLIQEIGRADLGKGPLVNFTDGGEGSAGHRQTPEQRRKTSERMRGRKIPPEVVERIATLLRGRKRGPMPQERKDKIGRANTGHRHTDQARKRMSAAGKGRPKTEAFKQFMSTVMTGRTYSAETLKKMSDGQLARSPAASAIATSWHASLTPEQKLARAEKISAATRAAMQRPEIPAKISAALTGRKQSPERIQLMKDSVALARALHPERFKRTDRQRNALAAMHRGNVGRTHSDVTKIRMSATQQRNARSRKG